MLTRNGWLTLSGAALLLAGGRLLGVVELYVVAGVLVVLVGCALAWVRRPGQRLGAQRRVVPDRIFVGGAARTQIVLHNDGARATPMVEVHEPVQHTVGAQLQHGSLPRGQSATLGYRLPTSTRGRTSIGPLTVDAIDPFGLARRRLATVEATTVTVLPRVDVIAGIPAGGGRHEPLSGMSRRSTSAGGSADLATLRAYVVGDDLRRVHWPTSARLDDLVVRRDEEQWQGQTTVLLDARRSSCSPPEFEGAVSAAASILHAVAESGDRARLVVTDGTDSAMVDARRDAVAFLDTLANVDQHDGDPDVAATDTEASALVVLTGPSADPVLAGASLIVRFGTDRANDASVCVPTSTSFRDAWTRSL